MTVKAFVGKGGGSGGRGGGGGSGMNWAFQPSKARRMSACFGSTGGKPRLSVRTGCNSGKKRWPLHRGVRMGGRPTRTWKHVFPSISTQSNCIFTRVAEGPQNWKSPSLHVLLRVLRTERGPAGIDLKSMFST